MATTTATQTQTVSQRTNGTKEPKQIIPVSVDAQEKQPEQNVIYTPWRLAIYDFWVLGIVATYAWCCNTVYYLVPQFRNNVGKNHLDIGVGTGYYLREAQVPASTKLTLVDLEQGALEVTKIRSSRPDARTLVADILKPLPISDRFDSVSLYYLFHCIPASMADKCNVFSHIKKNMTPNGVIHGANVLGKGVKDDNFFGAFIRKKITDHGVMHNQEDNAYEFEDALRKNFSKVHTRVVGSVFIFRAEGPKYDA